jgi:hypothetical protein
MRLVGLECPDAGGMPVAALTRHVEVAEGVWEVELAAPSAHVARAASALHGGQWWGSASGVVHVQGRQVTYYLSPPVRRQVEAAREALASLGVPAGWTLSGCARRLLAWLGPPKRDLSCSRKALAGTLWGYHRLVAGLYPERVLYDLNGAYWQVLCRLPSLSLDWLPTGPVFHPEAPGCRGRLAAVKATLAPVKPLRLVLVGCMIGGGQRGQVFSRGVELHPARPQGPFPSAGRLIARTVYEITCWVAEEQESPFAHTDCVLLPPGERPALWDRLGYACGIRAQGEADIRNLGSFRVGTRQTVLYGRGSRFRLPVTQSPRPAAWTWPAWH